MRDEERRLELLRTFKFNRMLAHRCLFPHRHKDEDPEFHAEMCSLLYSDNAKVALMAFRGGAKSTYLEEYVLLRSLFKEDVYTLIVGPKEANASQRLQAIRHELEVNDMIIELFGDQKAAPWSTTELKLANGVKIEAMGAGQSMRGKKDNSERPDAAAIDDLEDEENTNTEEARRKLERWLQGTLMPALHPTKGRVRFIGTAIHPKALIIKKCNDSTWASRTFPIMYNDEHTGEEKAIWPARFPLDWCHRTRQEYINAGNFLEWEQEYMCRAEDIAGKPFQARMLKIEPVPKVHLPVYMFVDPARTTKATSARTGYAAWSWIGNKLIVRRAKGAFHKPDEIVSEIRQWDTELKPVEIGVEANGLEEFLMQPLRVEMVRGGSMPVKAEHAPKDKLRFIEGLQPFYIAGDVIHAEHFPDLESELLQFPTGRIDVPNALAYALRMRAGRPVYEDFTLNHIAPVLEPHRSNPVWLCVSARPSMTAGALVQYVDGLIKIFAGWVYNEPIMECFERLLREALLIRNPLKIAAPHEQFDQYNNFGLPAAVRKYYSGAQRTEHAARSEGALRDWLRKQVRNEMAVLVNQDARWVINALSGGYARKLDKGGRLADLPVDNQYRVLMEAIECWVAWFSKDYSAGDIPTDIRYDYTPDGRKFITLRK